jgi:phosphoribosylformylglycinamidine cyclo-ligase
MSSEKLSYESAGVRYDVLDSFKRACQKFGATTTDALRHHEMSEARGTRGESAYLIETPNEYLAHVEEGLGTKNLVADEVHNLIGQSFYRNIGIDTVATIVNDLITCGALPISVAMHAAVGDVRWFENQTRARDLAEGFAHGCKLSGAAWGGGETPALRGIVNPDAIVLAGSALGRIAPKSHRITGEIAPGDAIILLASTGVHTNGLTLCRALADRLPQGYLTKLPSGRSYGEVLLDASPIYVNFITLAQQRNLKIHYAAHITGHGWRKLMRLDTPLVYRITQIPDVPEIFPFIQSAAGLDAREMYATFNMGGGFAIFVDPSDVPRALDIARETHHRAWQVGAIERRGEEKAVVIEPLGITFGAEELKVR